MTYDLIILGGGPAGYLAAERAGQADMNVLLIEKRNVGGVCLNEGCIPSKSLLYSAKLYDGARFGEKYGVRVDNAFLSHEAVIMRKNKVVKKLVAGVKAALRKHNVTLIEGEAEIVGKADESLDAFLIKAAGEIYAGSKLLIATGSVPVLPPVPGLKEGLERGYVLTNREILDLKSVPESLVIIGGGVIGLEMASYYNSAGSKVTIIEMLDHIAGNTDREISEILLNNYQKRGVVFKLGSKVTAINEDSVSFETAGQTYTAEAEKVLVSIGRKPFTDGLGLDRIGVVTERGRIVTDERGRTNVPGVYAAGDVNGISMLAHTAYREAEVCVNDMLGINDRMKYDAIPSIIYTNPEAASVGETEESAAKKGIEFETTRISMNYSGRYMAENEGGDGICKVIVDKGTKRLLGVHMIGNYSSENIYGAGLMIEMEMRVEDVKKLVFPHPTVSEIIREAIFHI